jgi:hypothetical protein
LNTGTIAALVSAFAATFATTTFAAAFTFLAGGNGLPHYDCAECDRHGRPTSARKKRPKKTQFTHNTVFLLIYRANTNALSAQTSRSRPSVRGLQELQTRNRASGAPRVHNRTTPTHNSQHVSSASVPSRARSREFD